MSSIQKWHRGPCTRRPAVADRAVRFRSIVSRFLPCNAMRASAGKRKTTDGGSLEPAFSGKQTRRRRRPPPAAATTPTPALTATAAIVLGVATSGGAAGPAAAVAALASVGASRPWRARTMEWNSNLCRRANSRRSYTVRSSRRTSWPFVKLDQHDHLGRFQTHRKQLRREIAQAVGNARRQRLRGNRTLGNCGFVAIEVVPGNPANA